MTATLWHGDCLDLLPQVADGSVDMVFADLPYGVTANKWDTPIDLAKLWVELLRVGKRNAAFVFTGTFEFLAEIRASNKAMCRYDLMWKKNQASAFLNANRMPLRIHETALVFYRSLPTYIPQKTVGMTYSRKDSGQTKTSNYQQNAVPAGVRLQSNRHPTSVLEFAVEPRCSVVHPTQKPVALLEWLVRTYTNPGDTVLDPTAGSGTTGVACLNTGRSFIGMEKDATYYATAQRRLAEAQPPLPGAA